MTSRTAPSPWMPARWDLPGRMPAGLRRIAAPVLAWLARRAQADAAQDLRRDIARVRRLAEQVRRSQPGYAADLEAAAAAFETGTRQG